MRVIDLAGSRPSRVVIGERFGAVRRYLPAGKRLVIVTDGNVAAAHGSRFPDAPVLRIGTGEAREDARHGAGAVPAARAAWMSIATPSCWGSAAGWCATWPGSSARPSCAACDSGSWPRPCSPRSTPAWAAKTGSTWTATRTSSAPSTSRSSCCATPRCSAPCRPVERVNGMAEIVKHAVIADGELMQLHRKPCDGGPGPRPGGRRNAGGRVGRHQGRGGRPGRA